MFGITGYASFIASSIALNIIPGSDTLYIVSKSAVGGRKKGFVSALGISTGILIHTLLVSLGLSAVLASSALLFNAMKAVGAAYLVIMGLRTIFSKTPLFETGLSDGALQEPLSKVYIQGVLTNALNPKVALFFLALLPQFVSADNPYGPLPFFLLGITFFTTASIWGMLLAFTASFLTRILNSGPRISKTASVISGIIYVALGLNVLRVKLHG